MASCVRILFPHNFWLASSNLLQRSTDAAECRRQSHARLLLRNERDILKRFQTVSSLRRLIYEVHDPPLLVLEHLDSNLLIESATKKIQSSEVKHVTKAVLQALSALHEGVVHTGG